MLFRPIPETWRGYRRRNRIAMLLLVVGFPLGVMLALVAKAWLGLANDWVFIGAVLVWCAAWGYAAIRVARWPCPRCGKPWLSHQEVRIGVRRACGNCGLGLYEGH